MNKRKKIKGIINKRGAQLLTGRVREKNIKSETNIRIFSRFEGGEIFKRFAKIIIWMMKGNG